jgi:outer membrane biosynthesis protein TonB
MSDDILDQATRALRAETQGTDDSARFTRSRILRSVHQTERRRRSYIAFVLPIAAVLVGSTAFAASGGNWKAVARAIGFSEPAPATSPPPPEPAPKVLAAPAPQKPEPEPEPETESEATTATVEHAAKNTKAEKTTKPAPAPEDLSDPEIALYKKAHQLHFEGGSPAAALAAWDSYLAKSPRGRFSAEASYNRAITLARLGRTAEAKAALQPFANGSYGSYRKESATQLIEGLDGR